MTNGGQEADTVDWGRDPSEPGSVRMDDPRRGSWTGSLPSDLTDLPDRVFEAHGLLRTSADTLSTESRT